MIPSQLVLTSGETFPGFSPSWQTGVHFGEVVFSTGMIGYVESMTDPSYAGQILAFTYPLIGNYGVASKSTWESAKIQVSGLVLASLQSNSSHRNSECELLDWLKKEKVPLITGVDTRELTKTLRKKGSVLGSICKKKTPLQSMDVNQVHLVKQVSVKKKEVFGLGSKKIIAIDCGMKENIMRSLLKFPVQVTRVPFDYDYSHDEYDGILLSNGPGDPTMCHVTIEILRNNLKANKSVMGICLGAQILALAIGAKTYPLPFGHRGQNHPCMDLERKKAVLTSQNHSYAIDENSLPTDWKILFRNLHDGSVEGIAHKTLPFFGVQFHPESSPGPLDTFYLFEKFVRNL